MRFEALKKPENYIKPLILIALLAWYGFFLVQKIDLTTADLGRHLKNGELTLMGDFGILKNNFYSYTNPDFSVVTHHWASGIIFFLFHKIAGFISLHLFFILISFFTFLLFFDISRKKGSFNVTAILSIFIIPLIAERIDIRPEIFSYLFSAIFFWILMHIQDKKIDNKWLRLLPLVQILWANTHIYFFLGPLLVGIFIIENLIAKKHQQVKLLAIVFIAVIAASFVNPYGLKGLTYPLKIFQNYGYRIVENQSVVFLQKFGLNNPNLITFEIIFAVLVLSFAFNLRQWSITNYLLAVFFSYLGWSALRNFTVFGFFALPIISHNISESLKNLASKNIKIDKNIIDIGLIALIILISLSTIFIYKQSLGMKIKKFGIGLMNANNNSAEFFKQQNLAGPIFNNYDIGSFLIYHFYPQEKVFVDNRPEAYPKSFFEQIYIPAQDNNDVFTNQDKIYNFNAIFFAYHDMTPWAQKFLIGKVLDPNWAPVFADNYAIIFLKRNSQNQAVIEKYEIAKNQFTIN